MPQHRLQAPRPLTMPARLSGMLAGRTPRSQPATGPAGSALRTQARRRPPRPRGADQGAPTPATEGAGRKPDRTLRPLKWNGPIGRRSARVMTLVQPRPLTAALRPGTFGMVSGRPGRWRLGMKCPRKSDPISLDTVSTTMTAAKEVDDERTQAEADSWQ